MIRYWPRNPASRYARPFGKNMQLPGGLIDMFYFIKAQKCVTKTLTKRGEIKCQLKLIQIGQ